jgi:hypothetical protein
MGLNKILGVFGKRIHCSLPDIQSGFQREHILEQGAAVFADIAEWQIAPVHAQDDEWT